MLSALQQKIALVLIVALPAPVLAQGTSPPPASGSDWSRVRSVQPGTLIRVSSQHRPQTCTFESADAESLRCTETRTILFFPVTRRILFLRPEVSSVKLSRVLLSGLVGGAIGTGAGVGIGAGLDTQYASPSPVPLTGFFGFFGALLGATVGGATDFLAGPTVYRAP